MKNPFYLSLSLFGIVIYFFWSCGFREKKVEMGDSSYFLDFEECLENERKLYLSEIADTIIYLELKTPDDLIVSFIEDIISIEDFYVIRSREGVDKFTKDGVYITSFGRRGQGPGEYNVVFGVDVDPNKKEIIISDYGKILYFDYDGNLMREQRWGVHQSIGFSDSVLWAGSPDLQDCKYSLYALNSGGDTINQKENPRYGKRSVNEGYWRADSRYQRDFYRYDNYLYYNGKQTNDTIFKLSGMEYTPYLVWNMGKYKLPAEYEAWYSWDDFRRYAVNYWGIPTLCESDRYFFFTCQRFWTVGKNEYEHYEDNYRYLLYDKKVGEGFNVIGQIKDDISFGPNLWPEMVVDGYAVQTIEWYKLSKRIKEGNYTVSEAAQKQFDTFDYGTNELLVMMRLR